MFYGWCKKFTGMTVFDAKRLESSEEKETAQLFESGDAGPHTAE